jgi:two-component system, chemotaxis family, CheB/CheR fusion protein
MAIKKAAKKRTAKRAAPGKTAGVRMRAAASAETRPAGTALTFPVVAIGASAGGLAAFTALLKALPDKSGMAFVLIQHLEPKHESALTALLSKATRMPVVEVSDGIAVEMNHVYVIPPNKNMTVGKGTLWLAPRNESSGPQRPIDEFSVALAEEQGNRAIGVVLSGTGSDGTYGLKTIKAAGGVTFAQDPASAQWSGMPLSAITAGSVDFVLSPKRIAAELARIGRHPYLAEAREVPEGSDLDRICLILRASVGVDFRL